MSAESSSRDLKGVFIASYLRHAWEDLEDSKRLAGRHNESYHAQQAAEKFLNAILVSEDAHPNTREVGHQLGERVKLIPDDNPWKKHLSPITFLENYATTTRYPRAGSGRVNRIADTAVFRVRAARDKLEKMILAAGVHFGVKLDFYLDAPATNTDPYRLDGARTPSTPQPR